MRIFQHGRGWKGQGSGGRQSMNQNTVGKGGSNGQVGGGRAAVQVESVNFGEARAEAGPAEGHRLEAPGVRTAAKRFGVACRGSRP